MAKFHGVIGYVETKETVPGVWAPEVTERTYTGDILKNTASWKERGFTDAGDSSNNANDDLRLNNRFSILADPYAYEHFYAIRYIKVMGVRWKVSSVEVAYPRLNLTVGGVYNGNET
jgi:hypothetical protein